MIKVTAQTDKVCVAKVHEADQDQVFDHWDSLPGEEQKALLAQVRDVDFQLLKRLVQQHLHNTEPDDERVLKPVTPARLPERRVAKEEYELCRSLGDYSIKKGEVAIVTASGIAGSGTTAEPVGMLPVGPVTGKSVFQLHAEKVRALNRRHKVSTRWHIFCHPDHLDATVEYFKENGHFRLNCSDIHFHAQELCPIVNRRGKLLLEGPGEIAMTTRGHGDVLRQLIEPEMLNVLQKAGVKYVEYFQSDNPLVKVGDSLFLGYHIKNQSQVTSKSVRKVDPSEAVGVFCYFNGTLGVVENSELPPEDRDRRNEDGGLVFSAGNIANHIFSMDFLAELSQSGFKLPYHKVPSRIRYLTKSGRFVRPSEPTMIQFQSFMCDALPEARRTNVIEVEREEEFSPIKNTGGNESPQTAQRDLSHLYSQWLKHACNGFDKEMDFGRTVEISPLYALDANELKEKIELPVDTTSDILL